MKTENWFSFTSPEDWFPSSSLQFFQFVITSSHAGRTLIYSSNHLTYIPRTLSLSINFQHLSTLRKSYLDYLTFQHLEGLKKHMFLGKDKINFLSLNWLPQHLKFMSYLRLPLTHAFLTPFYFNNIYMQCLHFIRSFAHFVRQLNELIQLSLLSFSEWPTSCISVNVWPSVPFR